MREQLEAVREKRYVGVADLASQAARILAEGGPVQERATVSEVPDERTIRYYLTEGLLSPAEDRQGTASVFGYKHLLQLLVVKKLQSEHLPIRKIRELVEGRSERQLERLLGGEDERAKNEALRYLEALLTKAAPPKPAARIGPPKPPGALDSKARALAPSFRSPADASAWERIEIEPGLELHIRGDYRAPHEAQGRGHLAQLILQVIESHGRRPRKGGSS
jgi:DNA-binding transcriptional MerR regulator